MVYFTAFECVRPASEEHYNKIKKQNYPELENVIPIQKPIGNEELVK
jgi:hypothetical protein